MGRLVLDASAAANFVLPDESNEYGENVLRRIQTSGALVPVLWNYEMGNLLSMAFRKRRINEAYRELALGRLLTLRIAYWDYDGDTSLIHGARIAKLADDTNSSFYDASYLYLARLKGLELATLDRPLRNAAEKIGVSLFAGG